MNSHARVLVVSRDEMLLRTRTMILGAFFVVQGAGRFLEATAALKGGKFDLIVLCHSLSGDECEALADACAAKYATSIDSRYECVVARGSKTLGR